MSVTDDEVLKNLVESNKVYSTKNKDIIKKHIQKQSPKIAVLTCSDSRVIPEKIFNKSIGEIFVIRVAGNIALDHSVIKSIEYAVDHLKVSHMIILGHTNCGAIKASETTHDENDALLNEIKKSFNISKNHFESNIIRQFQLLPERSKIVKNYIINHNLKLIGALYNIEDGIVEFLKL